MLLLAKRITLGTFHCIKTFLTWNRSKRIFCYYPLLGVYLFLLGSCSAPSNVEKAIDEKILHFGLGSEPQYLDPHLANSVSAHNVIIALIEGLVSEDPKTLKPVPGVAEKWDISENGLVYTFHLRKNAKWSNGDPVTAHDFVYSYKRILNPELASQYASMLHGLKNAREYHEEGLSWDEAKVGAIAIDDYTLQLTLENPTPYFLELLNHYSWFPAHPPTIEKFGAFGKQGTAWTRPGNYVGNGPFILSDHKVNSVIEVKKNPLYWDAQTVSLEGIRFYPIESADTEERAFHSGFLHLTQTVSPDRIDFLKENHSDLIHFESYLGTYFYRFNVEEPPFDDVRVRLAFNLATDRQAIVEKVTKGGQLPARCFTPPGTGGFSPESRFRFDPQKAKSLIQEYLTEKGLASLPKIELKYNTSEGHKKVAEALQGMWKNHLGAEIRLLNMEWKVFLSTIAKRDFSLARAGWIGDYVDANTFLHMWRTGDGHNNTGWSSTRYDELLELAAQESDTQKRFSYFEECEKLIAENAPILPIYFYVHVTLRSPTVKGWHPTLLDHHPYKYVRLENLVQNN
ncbi:MAG: peptide ABC transporter substrate-binding protein [Verrucomicrobiota bacterium]|nr:peptide ABC transporter substrate-binding protein [Verrucomicrobiota bacterium]